MGAVVKGTPELDFKDQNPHVCTLFDFAECYKKNTPEVASKILWSSYYIAVPSDPGNPYNRMKTEEERITAVKQNYYPEYSAKENKHLLKSFEMYGMSKEQTLLNIHLRKLEELTAHIDTLDLSESDQYDRFIKTMEKLPKIWDNFDKLSKKYNDSKKNKSSIEGGGELSVSEKRRNRNR